MRTALTFRHSALLALLLCVAASFAQAPKSALIRSFEADYKSSPAQAEKKFWDSLKSTPVVESIEGNPNRKVVTFLHKGNSETTGVMMYSPLPTQDSPPYFSRVADSSVWYRSFILPSDSRFTYAIEELKGNVPLDIEGRMKMSRTGSQRDQLNPKTSDGSSLVELAGAIPFEWCTPLPGLSRATQIGLTIQSKAFNEDRSVNISLPYDYVKEKTYSLLILFDHEAYGKEGDNSAVPASLIIDNLMEMKKIPQTIIVSIYNPSQARRMDDLTCNDKMVQFIADELIPMMRKEYQAGMDAEHTVIGGSSLGGLQAVYSGLKRPDVFGGVLSQGGSFWYFPEFRNGPDIATEYGWLNRQVMSSKLSKTHFYLQADLFEQDMVGNPLMMTRALRDTLVTKGFAVSYQDLAGGHEYANWKASFGECVRALLSGK